MKRLLLTSLLLVTFIGNVLADDVTFVASAPKSVVVNQRFRLTYTVNTTDAKEPVIGEIPGFELLMGPSISSESSYSNYYGQQSSSVSVTFTYVLLAKEEGTFTIPSAKITAAGKELTSNTLTVKVLPEGQNPQGAQGQRGGARQSNNSANIGDQDLFVRATLSKSNVYEQEAVLLTYKVYSAVNLTNLSYPSPELKGFNIQEVDLPQNKQFELEHYNGRNYNTVVWRQFVLFPQESGELVIPAVDFEAVVAVQSRRNMDPFEMMFSGFSSGYVNVNKDLRSNSLKLNVEKLPGSRPADFSGAVGDFSIKSSISSTDLKTNSEFTLKVTVKGAGNMRLMSNPVLELPVEFESYDPVIDNKFRLTNNGFQGEKVYEYLITPKANGTYTIPGAKFTYFNTTTKQYQTIESEAFEVKVAKGEDASGVAVGNVVVNKEKGKVLASDIRHIKFDNDAPQKSDEFFFTSNLYILLYVIPAALLVLFLIVYRKKVAENANVSLVRTKKANKVAVKRLKLAKKLMKENKVNEFYDEILKAMWGYTSDKLSIPVSQLSKDNIANELAGRGVDDELIANFKELLNEGEFARYAPGDKGATMDKVYTMSASVISKMENSIK